MSVGVSVYPHHKTSCVCDVGVLFLMKQNGLDENLINRPLFNASIFTIMNRCDVKLITCYIYNRLLCTMRNMVAPFGPPIRQDYPLNLSILISGGKETNKDSLSKGD